MKLEIVYGNKANHPGSHELAERISGAFRSGTLYLGYPILATSDEKIEVDAMLVMKDHGLTAFQIPTLNPDEELDWASLAASQDRLFNALESHLSKHQSLRAGRKFAVNIDVVTILAIVPKDVPPDLGDAVFLAMDDVVSRIEQQDALSVEIHRALEAALQRVSTIRPAKKRASVINATSRGATMKIIERGIANLDFYQKKAAIETPDGPQRIRGLAGSGKTIVLALKAALLHASHPELDISVTFSSRSLYQQFEDLITRFSFAHTDDKYDSEKLQILHAWGARGRVGMYFRMAVALGVSPHDFGSARKSYGYDNAFSGACDALLEIAIERETVPQLFDVVLIDEAQDLPASFFRLVHLFTRNPKRIIWAYDELQKLDDDAMASLEELFGTDESGAALVNLENRVGEARRDVVLPVCYRNSPWALATAHALGFGVYRNPSGLIQHFDHPELWKEIGYRSKTGTITHGSAVQLERSTEATPSYFTERLDPADAVLLKGDFESELAQDEWVAAQIKEDLTSGELEPDDIMVVLPSAITAKSRFARLSIVLRQAGIDCHLVGVGSSTDEFFLKDSVAVGHIYRAKGNEAPMVFVLDSQFVAQGRKELSNRNILFTAITRSKAWVRICGWGEDMRIVSQEIMEVSSRGFLLNFTIPTESELSNLRRINPEAYAKDDDLAEFRELLGDLAERKLRIDQVPERYQDLFDTIKQVDLGE